MPRLLASLQPRSLAVQSPLPPPELIDVLNGSTASTGQTLRKSFSFGLAGRTVTGEVSQQRVRLVARRSGIANAWRPRFEGKIGAAGSGSVVSGTVGWSRTVYAFTAGWFGFVAVLAGIGAVVAILSAISGHSSSAAHGAAFFAACLGFIAVGAALVAGATAAGRRDEQYLRTWLTTAANRDDHAGG